MLFGALLEKMKSSDEYIEDIGEALKELKRDPKIQQQLQEYGFTEKDHLRRPKYFDL